MRIITTLISFLNKLLYSVFHQQPLSVIIKLPKIQRGDYFMATKPYACLHINRIKTTSALTGAYNHNYRQGDCPENTAQEKSYLNRELINRPEGETYNEAFKRRCKDEKIKKVRKNGTRALEFMLTYSQKAVGKNFPLEDWCEGNLKWLKDNFGEENVVSAVLHMDETTPHIHAVVVPIKDGRLCATELLQSTSEQQKENGVRGYTFMQNSYAQAMQEFGLVRGIKKSVAKHTDIQDFYKAYGEFIGKELPEPQKNEDIYHYADRVAKEQRNIQIDSFKKITELEREIVELNAANGNAETIARLRREIDILNERVNENSLNESTILNAKRMQNIITALKNDYPDASSRNTNFNFLMELEKAGDLFNKGYSREEIDETLQNQDIEK